MQVGHLLCLLHPDGEIHSFRESVGHKIVFGSRVLYHKRIALREVEWCACWNPVYCKNSTRACSEWSSLAAFLVCSLMDIDLQY